MKRAILLLLCFMLIALSACKRTEKLPQASGTPTKEEQTTPPSQTETKPGEIKNDSGFTVNLEKHEQDVSAENGEPLVQLNLETPKLSVGGQTTKVSKQAAELISNYYTDRLSDAQNYGEFSLKEYAAEQKKEQGDDFTPLSLKISCKVTRNDGVLFSTLREYTEFSGGEDSNITYKTENFLADTGAMLTLEDVFKVNQAQYEKLLSNLVINQIKERMAKDSKLKYNDGYENNLMRMFSATDFYFDENGLTLIWQANTLGPGTIGAQFFTLSYGELKTVMNERWLK